VKLWGELRGRRPKNGRAGRFSAGLVAHLVGFGAGSIQAQEAAAPPANTVLLETITVQAPARRPAPRTTAARSRPAGRAAGSALPIPRGEIPNNPAPFEAQRERFLRRPGAEAVVSVTRQDPGNQANIREALEQTPGVYVTDKGENGQGTISMRGSDSSQTGPRSGRGVRAFIDGVPLGRIESGNTPSIFDLKAADYIEVYRGANSLRYGALATGGAINLVSKTGLTAPGAAISGAFGSYGNLQGQLEYGGAKDNFDYYLQTNAYHNRGYEYFSQNDSNRFSGNIGWRPNDIVDSRTYVAIGSNKQELPTSVPLNQLSTYRQSGYDPGNTSFPYNLRADFDYARIVNKTVFRLGSTSIEIAPYYIATAFDHLPSPRAGIVDVAWKDHGVSFRLEQKGEIAGKPLELVAGYRPTYETARYRDFQWVPGSSGNQKAALVYNDAFTSWLHESYAEAALEVLPRVRLFTGLQAFWTNRTLKDEYSGPVIAGGLFGPGSSNGRRNYDREFEAVNPKFGANWEYLSNHFLYGNISRSTEVPNSGDIFSLLGIEQTVNGFNNPNVQLALTDRLRMQKAWTTEVGVRGGWDRFNYDVTLYHMQLRDEILSQCALGLIPLSRLTPGQRAQVNGQYACGLSGSQAAFNADRTIHDGIETAFRTRPFVDVFNPGDHVFLNAVYNFNHFRFDNDALFGSSTLPVIPKHQAFGELGYRHPSGFYVSGNIRYIGERYTTFDNSGGNAFVVPAYALYGAKLGWKAPDNSLTLWFEARNLTDVAYVGDFTPSLRAADIAAGTPSVYPGTGRAFYAGFTKRFY
jgi:iron complex outermembrane receptor protein